MSAFKRWSCCSCTLAAAFARRLIEKLLRWMSEHVLLHWTQIGRSGLHGRIWCLNSDAQVGYIQDIQGPWTDALRNNLGAPRVHEGTLNSLVLTPSPGLHVLNSRLAFLFILMVAGGRSDLSRVSIFHVSRKVGNQNGNLYTNRMGTNPKNESDRMKESKH